MRWLIGLIIGTIGTIGVIAQEEEGGPPAHTKDPAKCVKYCYPKGGPESRPKGTPEGIPGSECQGIACGRINDPEAEGEGCHEGGGCTMYCSKVCCTCLMVCM